MYWNFQHSALCTYVFILIPYSVSAHSSNLVTYYLEKECQNKVHPVPTSPKLSELGRGSANNKPCSYSIDDLYSQSLKEEWD